MQIEGRHPPGPKWVAQGMDFDLHQTGLINSRKFRRLGLDGARAVPKPALNSPVLGLHGIPDLVLVSADHVVVVEFKIALPRRTRGMELQLSAYGLLAAEKWKRPCHWTAMITGRKMQVNWFDQTEERRQRVFHAMNTVRETLDSPVLPHSAASGAQCDQCEFLRFCNDRF